MQTGENYHHSITASSRDRRTRDRFQRLLLGLLPPRRRILDFGAGTGIDAKIYAAAGHTLWVHEPDADQRNWLAKHCREEIDRGSVIPTALPPGQKVDAITANFAVLNLIPDHAALFGSFAEILEPDGFVLASLLNPLFAGDVHYGWWRANLGKLICKGRYAVDSASGVIRYAPGLVASFAFPHFRLEKILSSGFVPWRQQYMFLLFRRA